MPRTVHVVALAALLVGGTTGVAVVRAATDDSPVSTAAEVGRTTQNRSGAPLDESAGSSASGPARGAGRGAARGDREADPTPREGTGTETTQRASAGTGRTEETGPPSGARPADAPALADATMRIPEIGLSGLAVVAYRGSPDDGPGTRIQNGGVAASPTGPRGGAGPGQVGSYLVTAHRTTSPAPFADLPGLRRGDHVYVRALGRVFDYRVTDTRWTSFRSRRSLAEQAAAVPGRPGVEPTRAMITLSTCATPEDHARGNYWSDEFGNPEHRIDKIGVLVGVRPARGGTAGEG